jgi:hypothetical protein
MNSLGPNVPRCTSLPSVCLSRSFLSDPAPPLVPAAVAATSSPRRSQHGLIFLGCPCAAFVLRAILSSPFAARPNGL